MGTDRRQAVQDLNSMQQEIGTLARMIEAEMDVDLAPHQLNSYFDRAKWIRQRLDHFDLQLNRIKALQR